MKRARPWRAVVPRLALVFVAIGLVWACGGPSQSATPSSSIVNSPSVPVPSASGTTAVAQSPIDESPSASALEPSPTSTPSPRATVSDVSARACTGSAKTRDFFSAIAEAVSWPVYCAVLPAGWFVEAGEYRLANGGQMVISYRTNAGDHLELREGRWCTDSAIACSPHDAVIGAASFAGLDGQLTKNGSSLVLYVDPGAPASWTATGTGIDEAMFRMICSKLGLVGA